MEPNFVSRLISACRLGLMARREGDFSQELRIFPATTQNGGIGRMGGGEGDWFVLA